MPTTNLTDKLIRSIKPSSKYVEYWDSGQKGLGLRVSPKGRKSWMMRYRFRGQRRRLPLDAAFPDLSLADARTQAQSLMGKIAEGSDPATERRNQRQSLADRTAAFGRLVGDYLRYAERRKRPSSLMEDKRQLEKDILPAWRSRRLEEIDAREVERLLERIKQRGALVQANRTRALLSTIFNYAIRDPKWQGLVVANPVARTLKPLPKEKPRERNLSKEEIRRLWSSLEDFDPVVAASYKLRLLTAQRSGEIRTMQWSEIDGDWWTIPGSKTKNGRQHRVFLSRQVQGLLRALKPLAKGDCVLPSPRVENQPIGGLNKANQRLREAAKLEDFRPHDLRRTAATSMGKLGVRPDVIGKVLNHTEQGVTARVYDQYSYSKEVEEALALWGERLEAIVSGKKIADVVSIRGA